MFVLIEGDGSLMGGAACGATAPGLLLPQPVSQLPGEATWYPWYKAATAARPCQNHSELPEKSLKAMVPVSLRQKGDIDSSNAVGAISADLATNIADPIKRFTKIQASMVAGKELFKGMKPKEAALMLQMLQSPGLLLMPLGLMSKLPPYNTVISNVPGPRRTMYWDGARLDGIYPASIVTEGIALNITLVSYDQNVDFGITACRRSMPQVQRLIEYMEQSLMELEEASGLIPLIKNVEPKPIKTKKKVVKKVAKKTAKKVTKNSSEEQ